MTNVIGLLLEKDKRLGNWLTLLALKDILNYNPKDILVRDTYNHFLSVYLKGTLKDTVRAQSAERSEAV